MLSKRGHDVLSFSSQVRKRGHVRSLSSPLPRGRNGELTTKQLVTIIVLIVSFIVILFLIFRLNLGETSDKEICHNSVTLRAQASVFAGPLECNTNYLCVSGGGDCEGITENSKIDVDSKKKNEIFKALADEMVSCWWQFGEGEVDYASGSFTGNAACSICSIAGFDENLAAESSVPYTEFYEYLEKTPMKVGGSETYLQYLYLTNDANDISSSFIIDNYLGMNIDFSKTYFILTGMSKSPVFGLWGDSNHIPVVIMERTPDNYNKIGCDEFLTRS